MERRFEVAVVGGGIAGYCAALTLKSLKKDTVWLGEEGFGEKLSSAEYIRNYPAFSGNGKEFSARLSEQMAREGVVLTPARIDGIYAMGDYFVLTSGEKTFTAQAVILASGVNLTGELAGEREFLGRGVSYCAVCDGALYKGKKIAAVVYGKQFLHEVEYLASFAKTVYAVCRGVKAEFQANNIQAVEDIPRGVEGGMKVNRLVCKTQSLDVDGVFLLKSATPPSALVGGLEVDGAHVKVKSDLSTNIEGLFAAGDVTGTPYQFVKAAGEGNRAAYSAAAYLNARKGAKV